MCKCVLHVHIRCLSSKFQLKELISSLSPSGDFFSFYSICSFFWLNSPPCWKPRRPWISASLIPLFKCFLDHVKNFGSQNEHMRKRNTSDIGKQKHWNYDEYPRRRFRPAERLYCELSVRYMPVPKSYETDPFHPPALFTLHTKPIFQIHTGLLQLFVPCGIYIVSCKIVHLSLTHAFFQDQLFRLRYFEVKHPFWRHFVLHIYEIHMVRNTWNRSMHICKLRKLTRAVQLFVLKGDE